MESRIETIGPKKLVGLHMKMSFSYDKTPDLWKTFMPRRGEVQNRATSEYISMQIFEPGQELIFSPSTSFEKWAVVEVFNDDFLPDGMEGYSLKGGLYAVFVHIGPASDFPETVRYIFEDWFPQSDYQLDNREHFEILPEDYRPTDPKAREEIWIPVKH
ncbi:MAG: GyrI-like domain-containing protein [Deltaproteobacteria bacterium]|jgi:AraC family transcriptional regulator|nr:GyrI-like domain-containing protein [Deltaproteobacteria bacterium]